MNNINEALLQNLIKIFHLELKKKLQKKLTSKLNGPMGKRGKRIVLCNFSTALFRILWKDVDYSVVFPPYSSTVLQAIQFLQPLLSLEDVHIIIGEHSSIDCPVGKECRHKEEIRVTLPIKVTFTPEREELSIYFFIEVISYGGHIRK